VNQILDDVDRAIKDIAEGRPVIVVDDEDRENEGDIIFAASMATPELLTFMIRYTSGVICVPLPGPELDRLQLPLMTSQNTERMRTAFTISVDARHGVTTGISAADRATTIKRLVDPATTATDLVRPGHIFPLRYAGPGTPRPRWTWPGWPGCRKRACSPRSSTTTARWPGCRSSASSRTRTAWR
jgi:3,4-dihydroxy 2-butanone 4-phosphate synthase/GTP cyclohydrolase II